MTYLRLDKTPNLGVHQTGSSSDAARLRQALPDIVFKLRQYIDLEG
jgi:hypothetical protein